MLRINFQLQSFTTLHVHLGYCVFIDNMILFNVVSENYIYCYKSLCSSSYYITWKGGPGLGAQPYINLASFPTLAHTGHEDT